jgi:hypothetical protein
MSMASAMSASPTPGRPRVRFSDTLAENSVASSKATATMLRSASSDRSRTSRPPTLIEPPVTS